MKTAAQLLAQYQIQSEFCAWKGKQEGRDGKGLRPTVRGTAMNPVDHPHGGGEGKHNGYLPQTPWAMYTKGYRTRSKSKSNKMIIKDRRK